eukprot:8797209-Alexandrium_andersonii.AAC.1
MSSLTASSSSSSISAKRPPSLLPWLSPGKSWLAQVPARGLARAAPSPRSIASRVRLVRLLGLRAA